MVRGYKLNLHELIVIRECVDEYVSNNDCMQCHGDLCEHCQALADLRQKLVNAVSLAEVGFEIVFSTAEELMPAPEEKAAVIQ